MNISGNISEHVTLLNIFICLQSFVDPLFKTLVMLLILLYAQTITLSTLA